MLRNALKLYGFSTQAVDGEIGKVFDFFFDDISWTIRYVIVDTQKWLPGGKVLISTAALGKPRGDKEVFPVNLTREKVESSLPVNTDKPVSRQMEERLRNHFNWPNYWAAVGSTDKTAAEAIIEAQKAGEHKAKQLPGMEMSGDPHLRSTQEVTRYKIQALGGKEVGHVEDFQVDDNNWQIRYLVVDTRNWLPGGRRISLATNHIKNVDWAKARVYMELTAEQIKESPEFNPRQLRDLEFKKGGEK